MKREIFLAIFLFLLYPGSSAILMAGEIRDPLFAKEYYPEDGTVLLSDVTRRLDKTPKRPVLGEIISILCPHAGYEYSGDVASYSYKQIMGSHYNTVVIVGPSHKIYFPGISVYKEGVFKTPLGEVEIDKGLALAIINESEVITFRKDVHMRDHSIEVQLPFLQVVLPNFKIVPILMGDQDEKYCRILANAIVRQIRGRKDVLLVASTNLSHLYPYTRCLEMDTRTLELVEKLDPEGLLKAIHKKRIELCGSGALVSVILASKELGADEVKILEYKNSGDVLEKYARCTGYGAAAIYTTRRLTRGEKKRLLQIAKTSISHYAEFKTTPSIEDIHSDRLLEKRGVFVRIRKKGKLRAQAGYTFPIKPLYEAVRDAAIKATAGEVRFPPIEEGELKDLQVEISVFSPLRKIVDLNDIIIGRHGIYIRRGEYSGFLIPQIPAEQGWTKKEDFLDGVCKEAGLSSGAWREEGVTIKIFTTQVAKE